MKVDLLVDASLSLSLCLSVSLCLFLKSEKGSQHNEKILITSTFTSE